MTLKEKKKLSKYWFLKLQNIICNTIEKLEEKHGAKIKFKKNKWKNGEFRIINGEVIEKGGVAFSNVKGKFSRDFAKKIPGAEKNTSFWSTGVSVVLHPKSPRAPSMHFNTRFICTKKKLVWWRYGCNS